MDGKLIILPGSNPAQQDWAQRVAEEIGGLFEASAVLEYLHWQDSSLDLNFQAELARLNEGIAADSRFFIFAKSFGSMLALTAEVAGLCSPQCQFFAGLPIIEARKNAFPLEQHLRQLAIPTLFIQNRQDPYGRADELALLLSEQMHAAYKLLTLDRSDHNYPEMEIMRVEIEKFIKRAAGGGFKK